MMLIPDVASVALLLTMGATLQLGNHSLSRAIAGIRVVWRYGDGWSKLFLTILLVAVAVSLGSMAWILLLLYQGLLSLEACLAYGIAVTSAALFRWAWAEPFYNISVVQACLDQDWYKPEKVQYVRERIRYLSSWGRAGRFPGTIAWGVLGWVLFSALVAASVPFVNYFAAGNPAAGFYAFFALVVVVSLGFWVSTGLRNRRLHLEAASRGYDLVSTYPRGHSAIRTR